MSTLPFSTSLQSSSLVPVRRRLRSAAVLNANARQVNRQVRARVHALMPGAVHMTNSLEEAESTISHLLDEKVEVIFAGGGDGTIIQIINSLIQEATRRGTDPASLPMVSILPFGTGNALASHLEISSALGDLALIQNGAPTRVESLRLLDCAGHLSPFAGLGIDAMIVNDFNDLKNSAKGKPMGSFMAGLSGYFASIFSKTLPRALDPRTRFAEVEVINHKSRAWRLNSEGVPIESFEPGEVLYKGKAMIAAASTVSCYGFGLKLFPFATQSEDHFQLRIYSGGALKPALHIPQIFSGTFTSPHMHDFLAEDVTLRFDGPSPFQVGGDAQGWREEVHFGMTSKPLPVLMPARDQIH